MSSALRYIPFKFSSYETCSSKGFKKFCHSCSQKQLHQVRSSQSEGDLFAGFYRPISTVGDQELWKPNVCPSGYGPSRLCFFQHAVHLDVQLCILLNKPYEHFDGFSPIIWSSKWNLCRKFWIQIQEKMTFLWSWILPFIFKI